MYHKRKSASQSKEEEESVRITGEGSGPKSTTQGRPDKIDRGAEEHGTGEQGSTD